MSQPDEQSIVNEIRSARITASPDLRARVAAIAAAAPAAEGRRPRRELPWRRLAVVLVPACAAVAAAAALAVGLSSSGNGGSERAARGEAAPEATPPLAATADSKAAGSGSSGGAALPATSGRAQLYEAELTLKIADLSAATKRALRLTRDFDGYVRSVEYGSGSERGSRVSRGPRPRRQRPGGAGALLGARADPRPARLDPRRAAAARPAVPPAAGAARPDREAPGEAREPVAVGGPSAPGSRTGWWRRGGSSSCSRSSRPPSAGRPRYATVSLDLRSKEKAVVVPHEPGRIGRALHRSGQIVADEAKVLVYVLVVGRAVLRAGRAGARRSARPAPPP